MANDIYENMAAFDFSAPINVTIIYDDSDVENVDIIAPPSDEKQSKRSDDQSTLIKKTSNLTEKKNTETSQLGDSCSERILNENKRSRIEVDERNKNRLEVSTITKPSETDIVLNGNINTDLSPGNTTICKSPNGVDKLTNITALTLGTIDVEVMMKEYQEARKYIHDLLTSVSKHLIMIINAYEDHTRIVNEYKNHINGNLRIQDSKLRYFHLKTQNFKLSYSVVVSVILTQENNHDFVNEFLKNTVKMAHDENKLHYTVQYIQPFFYDLLWWTQQNKNHINNNPANELQKTKQANINSTPLLTKQLSQPALVPPLQLPKSSRKDKKAEKKKVPDRSSDQLPALSRVAGNQEHQSIPIFSSGPPDQEVRISVQPDLLYIQNQQMAQITNTQRRPPPSYFQPHSTNYRRPENNYLIHQNQSVIHHYVNNFAPSDNVAVAPIATNNQYVNQTVNDQNKQYSEQAFVANTGWISRPSMNQASQSLPTLREFRPHHSPGIHQHQHHQDYRNYEHSFSLADKNQPYNSTDRYEQNLQSISPKKVVESGRSVSTDSGFVSPSQFSTRGDRTPGEYFEQSNQFAPLITHVTSLNPNAVQIAEGSCHVCGKPTKKKCMGCYQAYYCNYQCEKADWSNHMFLCKRSTGT